MPTRTEAIKRFLESKKSDFTNLYSLSMECQVNVAQDGGERIEGDFKGRRWHGWTDGLTKWKSFRIPYKANTEPEYEDKEIRFDLADHAEGIGMTGWDWQNQCSKWVAFDFDALIGHSGKHSKKLTDEELEQVRKSAFDIPWVTIRKSSSGKGLHLYVHLDDVSTKNHTEHAALARSILGMMSAIAGFDFYSKVDNCGGNMWIWHRKCEGTDGFALIKKGSVLKDVPRNWRDHLKVVTGQRRKNLPQDIESSGRGDSFEELTGQRPKVPFDDGHKALIAFFRENDALWWWDQDHHMLVTHTYWLQRAHDELELRGYFKTNSEAKNLNEQNCFAFPLRRGAWTVRRYTPGVSEDDSWDQDGAGWTRCFFNKEPDLGTACRAFGGLEDPSGGFVFREAEVAEKAAELLGVRLKIATPLRSRKTKLKQHKDGRLIVEIEHDAQDTADEMKSWLPKKGQWTKLFNTQISSPVEPDVGSYDDMVRHLVTEVNEDYGWMIKSDMVWRTEPLSHVRVALGSMGLVSKEITVILGSSVFRCWKVVNKPFQPEYPGDREWNRNAAQFRFAKSENDGQLLYPTWLKILDHCGKGLDDTVKENAWSRANGILTGADYLKCWIASLFQEPMEPLPYLFFYGPQNSGKSIFHEALSLLLTKGYKRADAALISQQGFNAELEGAIICVVEETDLRRNRIAYNRIKDWVTSRDLLIHAKGGTPYHIPNSTHWVQCSNDHQACPVFSGDTRITMSFVDFLDPISLIPKKHIIPLLEKEAPDFLAEVCNLELPPSYDRLNVPVLDTADKAIASQLTQTHLEQFLSDMCKPCNGHWLKFSSLYSKFIEWLDPNEIFSWSKIRTGRELPPQYPKGRNHKDAQFYVGNITWKDSEDQPSDHTKYMLRGEFLDLVTISHDS
jgi:hypothetical protein